MSISYLTNQNDDNFLYITNRLLTFNNIRLILDDLPYVKQNNISPNTLTKPANTLLEHQKNLLFIDHININISLDVINQNDNIFYNNFMLFLYDQNINLNFKNYTMYTLLEKYNNIIQKMMKTINFNQYSFNKDLLSNTPNTIIELLQNRKYNTDSNLALIDIYLKDMENVPESENDLYNYIYILRKFPMFKNILNYYLEENEPELYSIISQNSLEIDSNNDIFLPFIFDFSDNEKIIKNVNNLFKKNYYLNDFFYIIKSFNIQLDSLISAYNEINFQEYGFSGEYFTNIEILIEKFINTEAFDIYIIFALYLKINYVDITTLNDISIENLHILLSIFLVNLYVIYDYLNLNEYTSNGILEVYADIPVENYDYQNTILTELLFYIHISYYVFKSNSIIYNTIDNNINLLKHFLYIIRYSKNILPETFPLIFFLSCSNKNIKFIYEYKDNNILDFLNEYYDIIYENAEKIVIKKD